MNVSVRTVVRHPAEADASMTQQGNTEVSTDEAAVMISLQVCSWSYHCTGDACHRLAARNSDVTAASLPTSVSAQIQLVLVAVAHSGTWACCPSTV